MVRVKLTAKEDAHFNAKREAIRTMRSWGSESRRDARRCRRGGLAAADAPYHAALARAFFRAAAYMEAETKNEWKKLCLKKIRKREGL